ncbi:uncharacterized protein LOC6621301 isoform X6 [Drosophila sechellia]|uniref:uncharacterized protein LOC6620693 isoform X6 n=1 Tax=Drosophila sechellia TaxID=7238 RepID=UPI0013DE0EAA|nr:uncharacterized protein LOC6620693 isoform X6 [Drosophila sechellia]XP_032573750.1 uncharacterized protein LOC6621301 isoform X6 [Drosophila sechellia]
MNILNSRLKAFMPGTNMVFAVKWYIAFFFAASIFVMSCSGHGRLVEPPSRASAWRFGFQTPPDYNDHELYCGGLSRQWQRNGGKCGECGDAWDVPEPRPHEYGGHWGKGLIVRSYLPGSQMTIRVELTASHMGYFEFRICPNPNAKQSCLDKNVLSILNGSPSQPNKSDLDNRFYPRNGSCIYEILAQLPAFMPGTNMVFAVKWYIAFFFAASIFVMSCSGHGRLVEPPSRASAWRFGFQTPPDYNDHELYCGGLSRQWQRNGGKCGECGDAWDVPEPRPHEYGGHWGKGLIVRSYLPGSQMTIRVELTASHMGYFEFRICPNPNAKQSCLDKNVLSILNGSPSQPNKSDLDNRFYPRNGSCIYEILAQLPVREIKAFIRTDEQKDMVRSTGLLILINYIYASFCLLHTFTRI